jgi:prepilin-type N-terminal cleavage/methylation domain-containing protein
MPSWRRVRSRAAARPDESGFTLIELIVGISILALIIGAISAALITVFADSGATSKNIADSADAQVVSATLTNDVQSAVDITTSSTASHCGTGTQLLGLEWARVGSTTSTTFDTVVSYLAVQQGSTWSLMREECLTGSSTPVNRSTVSSDICEPKGSAPLHGCPTTGQPTPSITPRTKQTSVRAGWASSQGVTGVTFAITEPGSHYTYTLVSDPLPSNAPAGSGTVAAPTPSCGYAAPGTGTYAQTLCFVNFAKYKYATAATCPGQKMTEGITGTPFTLTFRLCVRAGIESNTEAPPAAGSWSSACHGSPAGTGSGVPPPPNPPATLCASSSADIVAVPLPTYTNPPASEAFLGNNGFYTGVPGDPGLYSYIEGTDVTLYFTTVKVLDQNGNAATNWDLVTGDAESTDTTESITWSTCPATGSGGQQTSCAGAPTLNLIPNNPSSTPPNYYGNACLNTKYQQDWLTYGSLAPGAGTAFGHTTAKQEVQCAAGVSEDKTGTVMLEAPEPSTLTVNMVGTGLQAVFLGFLL